MLPTLAFEQAQQALKSNPSGFPEARLYLATAYLNTGDYVAAEREARETLTAAGESLPQAYHVLGVALAKQGRVEDAVVQLELFLRKAPGSPTAEVVKEHIRLLRGQNQ